MKENVLKGTEFFSVVCRSSKNGDVLSKILMGTTFLSQANGNAENPDFCGKSQRTCEMSVLYFLEYS